MDSLKLELLKNKQEHAQSAIASQEVREHLAGFIRSKRQGSANQINNIQLPSSHHLYGCGQGGSGGGGSGIQAGSGGGNNCYTSRYNANSINEGAQDDDHPLRKTASMPTMHIPYKAQSLSRRRQMERRTTMSPLMRRKSKPKRQLLHSQDSSSTDYSSNPCIIQSTQAAARSLSQSSTPPPPPASAPSTSNAQSSSVQMVIATNEIGAGMTGASNQQLPMATQSSVSQNSSLITPIKKTSTVSAVSAASCQQQSTLSQDPSSAASPSSSQAIKLSSIFTNRELEKLQNNLKNSLYFSTAPHPSNTNQQKSNQSNSSSSSSINNNHINNNNNNDLQLDQNALRHQQHLKVNEAIRKTVIQRASNKGRMPGGGSLDMDGSLVTSGETNIGSKGCSTSGSFGDELRQWSLDGADLRTNAVLNKLAGTTLSGGLFHRDFHKLRLATTKDAATLRRSQSPSSSISMGLSSGQAVASIAQQQQQQQTGQGSINPSNPQARAISGLITKANAKQYSSSSSSTSSLLSQQDSLEDSSSQAIDLSSSSEAGRRHQQSSASLFASVNASRSQIAGQLINCTSGSSSAASKANQQYQKVVQESFNQLQLCHSQETMNPYLLPSQQQQQQVPSQHHTIQRGDSSTATCQHHLHHHHPPSLMDASKTATSLDATNSQNLIVSLSKQFNLSASAQNLISIQDHHLHHNQLHQQQLQQQLQHQSSQAHNDPGTICPQPLMAHQHQQQHDLNQLMLAYKNLVQSPDGQQAGQISSALLAKMTNLPEAYKSSLMSHLIQQQQQHQQQQQFRTLNTVGDTLGVSSSGGSNIEQDKIHAPHHLHQYQNHEHSLDQRSLISRALSSPLLASTETTTMNVDTPLPPAHQHQDQVGFCEGTLQRLDMMNIELEPSRIDHSKILARDDGRSTDSSIGMIIDSVDDRILDKAKSKQFSITEQTSHSLDLTTSSRSVSESSSGNKSEGATALSFSYTPTNPKKASYSFIYNPVFDKNSSTGLTYELGMCNHKCICGDENNHPENSHRILAIWRRLYDTGLMGKCAKIEARRATLEEIQLCHSETYSYYFGKGPYERLRISQLDLSKLPIEGLTQLECGGQGADIDTAWNEEQTPGVARLAAGCVIEATVNVANGKLMNAFAVVRPPGHHAEFQQAMGFCFFNSVAIAARVLISKYRLTRILIVDWDVHHGNGIQKMFYDDKRVMYISLHRHDKGNFFPGTGDIKETGIGLGEGYNWNIAWSGSTMGDAEYLAAFRCLVMPIAVDYNPSMVLVACGFDAARGHPFNFGGYDLSPACFAYMTRQLMSLADGRLVLCLEGGYQLNTICDCAESCVRALLNESHLCPADQVRESELRREPNQSAIEVLFEVSSLAAKYWPNVERRRCTIGRSALDPANVR